MTNNKPICPICENEEIEPGQKFCQICGHELDWKEEISWVKLQK